MTQPPRLVDYTPLFDRAREPDVLRGQYKRKLDALLDSSAREEVDGDRLIREVERILDSFDGFVRSDAQKDFHAAFINAVLPHVFGRDYERFAERLKRERSIGEIQQEVLICCPRRFGKTTAVSMFIAAMLYVVPDTWISCFSTGQRASTTLLDQAARFFNTLPNAKEKILKKNQEQFFIRGADGSDVRRFHSFPSSVAGLKVSLSLCFSLRCAQQKLTKIYWQLAWRSGSARPARLLASPGALNGASCFLVKLFSERSELKKLELRAKEERL